MTPNTTVTLYATPFDISNKYVIAAASEQEALGIVNSYPSRVYTDCFWQRTNEWVFRANGNINEVEQYNYCVFLNNGKYNFAFITGFTYINDAMTLVHLAIDPWLNYAGKYIFHDSPMVRCHPIGDAGINFHTEPYTIEAWKTDSESFGEPYENYASSIFIVTTLNGFQYDATAIDNWLSGLGAILTSGDATKLKDFYDNLSVTPCSINGSHIQAPTQYTTSNGLPLLVKKVVSCGRESDLIGAYYIPQVLVPEGISSDGSIVQMGPVEKNLSLTIPPMDNIHWRKIRYSEQFNRLFVNMCGSINYLPFNNLKADVAIIRLKIRSDPSYNGCIYAYIDPADMYNSESYMLHSQGWDKIQISGFGIPSTQITEATLRLGSTVFDQIKKIGGDVAKVVGGVVAGAGAGATGGVPGAIAGGIAGAIKPGLNLIGDIGSAAVEITPELAKHADIARSGGYAGSFGTSSMSAYNMVFPLITLGLERPRDASKIEEMFGTFGYMQDGDICSIVFKRLPYWHYYCTQNAAIEGRQVPQRYLSAVISMFNNGVFVFNSPATYKDFSKAQLNHY